MEETVALSIIVPIYNLEQYLPRCLDSILSQTYRDFELILVDDGSVDGSLATCRAYAEKDDRIRVFHKENGGVSSARNYGMERAMGTFIAFVDGDDYLELDMFERLLNDLLASGAGIASCQLDRVTPGGQHVLSEEAVAGVYSAEDIVSRFFENGFIKECMYGPYNKVFRRECIGDIRFKLYAYGEDILFVFETLKNAGTVYIGDHIGYHYRMRDGSAVKTAFSLKRLDYVKAAREVEQSCERLFPQHAVLARRWVYGHVLITVRQLLRNGMCKTQKEYIAEEKRYLNANRKHLRSLPFRYKVIYCQVMCCLLLIRRYGSIKENG